MRCSTRGRSPRRRAGAQHATASQAPLPCGNHLPVRRKREEHDKLFSLSLDSQLSAAHTSVGYAAFLATLPSTICRLWCDVFITFKISRRGSTTTTTTTTTTTFTAHARSVLEAKWLRDAPCPSVGVADRSGQAPGDMDTSRVMAVSSHIPANKLRRRLLLDGTAKTRS